MATTAKPDHGWAPVRSQTFTGAANTIPSSAAPGTVFISTEAMTVTLPAAAAAEYPVGTQFFIVNDGDHVTTVAAGTGNTIDGDLAGPNFAGSCHVVTCVADNTWVTGQVTGA